MEKMDFIYLDIDYRGYQQANADTALARDEAFISHCRITKPHGPVRNNNAAAGSMMIRAQGPGILF